MSRCLVSGLPHCSALIPCCWMASAGLALRIWSGLPGGCCLRRRIVRQKSLQGARLAGWAAMQRGFLTNLLNPKALMFCALFLPQFIAPQRDMFEQYVVLGVLLVSVGLLFDAFYALAATGLAKRFSGSPCGQRIQKVVFAGVFGVAAIRLAVGGN